jgi:hypothetical protein
MIAFLIHIFTGDCSSPLGVPPLDLESKRWPKLRHCIAIKVTAVPAEKKLADSFFCFSMLSVIVCAIADFPAPAGPYSRSIQLWLSCRPIHLSVFHCLVELLSVLRGDIVEVEKL